MSAGFSESIRNVIILGPGPAGYTAAIDTARADLALLVIAVKERPSKTSLPGVFDPTYHQAITAAEPGCVVVLDVVHFLAAGEETEPRAISRTAALV